MARIAIVNMSGARNRGCEALVRCTLDAVRSAFPSGDYEVELHTEDPTYDSAIFRGAFASVYRQYPLLLSRHGYRRSRNRMAYTLARTAERLAPKRFDRYRSLSAMRRADLIILTGGDILTSDYNALTAYASPLLIGPPVVLLGHTIGPFAPADEAYFRRALDNVVLCTCRESLSFRYMTEVGKVARVAKTADLAFGLEPAGKARTREILEVEHRFPADDAPMIALAASAGLLSFRRDVHGGSYFDTLVRFVDRKNRQGYRIVLVPHVQDASAHNNDLLACLEILRGTETPAANVVLSAPLTAAEFKGVIGRCVGLVGARTHATIASMSQGVPTVAIAYSRKAWGIMADYYGEDLARELTIDATDLSPERLSDAFDVALQGGPTPEAAHRAKAGAMENHRALRDVVEDLGLTAHQVPQAAVPEHP